MLAWCSRKQLEICNFSESRFACTVKTWDLQKARKNLARILLKRRANDRHFVQRSVEKEQMDIIQQRKKAQNQAGTKLLPFGFKYSRISISPDEAQFIETQVLAEICAFSAYRRHWCNWNRRRRTTTSSNKTCNLHAIRLRRAKRTNRRRPQVAGTRAGTVQQFNLNAQYKTCKPRCVLPDAAKRRFEH